MSTPWTTEAIEHAIAKQRVEHPNEFRILKGRDAKGVDMAVWLDKKSFCVKRKGTIYYFTAREAVDYLNAFEFSEVPE
jgi:hypothetical protein